MATYRIVQYKNNFPFEFLRNFYKLCSNELSQLSVCENTHNRSTVRNVNEIQKPEATKNSLLQHCSSKKKKYYVT